jgi:transcription-repair coupling factor (superfamily II helicase)
MKDLKFVVGRFIGECEQSGFINEIGFDTYQKIMNEAIEERKTSSRTCIPQRII